MSARRLFVALAALPSSLAPQSPVKEAERLAAEAIATAVSAPAAALAAARRALALTAEFIPTSFIRAGRRGEVVEDEYMAARGRVPPPSRARVRGDGRRTRRAGAARCGRALSAPRHGAGRRATRGRPGSPRPCWRPDAGRDALDLIHERGKAAGGIGRLLVPSLERAVDAEGRPSVQVEIDLSRLSAVSGKGIVARDGPVRCRYGAAVHRRPPAPRQRADRLLHHGPVVRDVLVRPRGDQAIGARRRPCRPRARDPRRGPRAAPGRQPVPPALADRAGRGRRRGSRRPGRPRRGRGTRWVDRRDAGRPPSSPRSPRSSAS